MESLTDEETDVGDDATPELAVEAVVDERVEGVSLVPNLYHIVASNQLHTDKVNLLVETKPTVEQQVVYTTLVAEYWSPLFVSYRWRHPLATTAIVFPVGSTRSRKEATHSDRRSCHWQNQERKAWYSS
jgi:hypothetical protein